MGKDIKIYNVALPFTCQYKSTSSMCIILLCHASQKSKGPAWDMTTQSNGL